jgi:alpha-mannosidase
VVIESGVGGDFPKGKFSFCQIDKPNVMAIGHKAAEDGRGIIMRLFETSGTETEFSLSFPSLKVGAAYLTDLYEDDAGLLKAEDSRVYLSVGAYGIATVRAVFL